MCFHKWTKWESYVWEGTVTRSPIWSKNERAITSEISQKRQKRKCKKCGYEEDRLVREG